MWDEKTVEWIAEYLGRSPQAVKSRARSLGLKGQIQPSTGPTATKNRIIKAIQGNGSPMTIKQISASIEVDRAIVHQHILDLCRTNDVKRAGLGERKSGRGRPPVLWDVGSDTQ